MKNAAKRPYKRPTDVKRGGDDVRSLILRKAESLPRLMVPTGKGGEFVDEWINLTDLTFYIRTMKTLAKKRKGGQ